MKTILDVLEQIRQPSHQSTRELGDKFEHLMVDFLKTDPEYMFEEVSLWRNWADRPQQVDTGIDIVAKDEFGKYCAVQCKCFDENTVLTKEAVDSFFTASGQRFKTADTNRYFDKRLIITTTDQLSRHLQAAVKDQQIETHVLTLSDLKNSSVDWEALAMGKVGVVRAKKTLRPHQEMAVKQVIAGFEQADRGKLIMACGTGKTFTALKIAEQMVSKDGIALFLVPSIALLSQTLREWTAESARRVRFIAVCSDSKVRKEAEDISAGELKVSVTTDVNEVVNELQKLREKSLQNNGLTVIFSTYQSLDVIERAQQQGLMELDLVICDEAHRTTGVTLVDKTDSNFTKVHHQKFIKVRKRLYMTATPRLFHDDAKKKAEESNAVLCSMDDPSLYGDEFYRLNFGEAVAQGLLSDYKVMILAVEEEFASRCSFDESGKELSVEDKAKIIGCWNGLEKRTPDTLGSDTGFMRRAVAFAGKIEYSKKIASLFRKVIDEYIADHPDELRLKCEVDHVDGKMGMTERNQKLQWLKAEPKPLECRILSNARCLSEGVDVPALDAVIFFNPRNSQVDVVQSVGRVMRKSEGKQYGYVILPIVIKSDVEPEQALDDNERYKVVWQVLQALRAHDQDFNVTILPDKISFHLLKKGSTDSADPASSEQTISQQIALKLNTEQWQKAIFARIVKKCGERLYWEKWAKDIAEIVERHIKELTKLVRTDKNQAEFAQFLNSLQKQINPFIAESDAIDMLAQHLVTKRVFDALFGNDEFTAHNPVSQAMQQMLATLGEDFLQAEREQLEKFYQSVERRVEGIKGAKDKQKVIVELYDKFFKNAFPKVAERLGIVYTPVEVVDFIIHSVEVALQQEFGSSVTDENVHILDPFIGTGTFMVRLLQSDLIQPTDLQRKFTHELHANEIMLLAYYIAAINIETTYHEVSRGAGYQPFEGMVLTDTFQMYETRDLVDTKMLPENHERVKNQKKQPIQVIIGNPPYSAGQTSENDNNKNLKYPTLDEQITKTYAASSSATLKNSLYDSYIRAIRWASDRIKEQGVICFVTNGSFIDNNAMNGVRKCLTDEFTSIYCFNLRGNARTSGEQRRMEKGNVFGEGTRTPVAITLLIKNPARSTRGQLFYHDIGDYLSREEKLNIIKRLKSIDGIAWQQLTPNDKHDWINQRCEDFASFVSLGDKKDKAEKTFFEIYSNGVKTNRDTWTYNFAKQGLIDNMSRMIAFFNAQVADYHALYHALPKNERPEADKFIDFDATKISWTVNLKADVERNKKATFDAHHFVKSMYRPFCKQWLYFDRQVVERVLQFPKIFPNPQVENLVICVSGTGVTKDFNAFIVNCLPDVQLQANGQGFPLYTYEETAAAGLFDAPAQKYTRHDNLSDAMLKAYQKHYADSTITKVDIFYYIYGILHAPSYKTKYAADLKKMLPRIPFAQSFWLFSNAGKQLAHWHLNYETVTPYPLEEIAAPNPDYSVQKMQYPKVGKVADKTTLIYNAHITLKGIPPETYEYIVNGKPALDWIIDRYQITVDKDSGIQNDPNQWSEDPRYILDLIKRIVTVSIESVKIINTLKEEF